jgi:hypothetical protein
MDLFRKIKKNVTSPVPERTSLPAEESHSQLAVDAVVAEAISNHINSIDDLVDSDQDSGAEIFDDDEDNDNFSETPSKQSVAGSSSMSPKSFHEVVQSLASGAASPLLLSIPAVIQRGGRESNNPSSSKRSSQSGSKRGEENDDDSDSAEDYSDDEDEGLDSYKPGGYHPVEVGEVYNQRCVSCREFMSSLKVVKLWRTHGSAHIPSLFYSQIRNYQKARLGPLFYCLDGQGPKGGVVLW